MTPDKTPSVKRLTVERYEDHAWGGVKYGVWDHEWKTWRDDIGWFMTEDAAHRAIAAHGFAARHAR